MIRDLPDNPRVMVELVEITHDSKGLRLTPGTLAVRFTVRGRDGASATLDLPSFAAEDIADHIKAWQAGDETFRPVCELVELGL